MARGGGAEAAGYGVRSPASVSDVHRATCRWLRRRRAGTTPAGAGTSWRARRVELPSLGFLPLGSGGARCVAAAALAVAAAQAARTSTTPAPSPRPLGLELSPSLPGGGRHCGGGVPLPLWEWRPTATVEWRPCHRAPWEWRPPPLSGGRHARGGGGSGRNPCLAGLERRRGACGGSTRLRAAATEQWQPAIQRRRHATLAFNTATPPRPRLRSRNGVLPSGRKRHHRGRTFATQPRRPQCARTPARMVRPGNTYRVT